MAATRRSQVRLTGLSILALMVVLQEGKFKSFFNKLSYALEQHEERRT